MLTKIAYETLLEKYGKVASFTIWSAANTRKVTSNIDDLSIFDDPSVTNKLNADYIFVALNGAGHPSAMADCEKPDWNNFHSGYAYSKDYKLRYAIAGTKYEGSYITDLIKYYPEVHSEKVRKVLKNNTQLVEEKMRRLEEELRILEASNNGRKPTIIALGTLAYNYLSRQFTPFGYTIKKATHYSAYISAANYKNHIASF